MKDGWYRIADIDSIDSPALVLYGERIRHNIALALQMTGDAARLRPHIKTHKTAEVVRLMMAAGITKFKCATIAEAELPGLCGARDVLLAYQPVGPKLQRFLSLIKKFPQTRYACLVDNEASAKDMAEAAQHASTNLQVFIDLNAGMNRTGVEPENALALYAHCSKLPALEVVGIHAYDGQVNDTDLFMRSLRADAVFNKADSLRKQIRQHNKKEMTIVIGGSPTFPLHAQRKDVECSPGTFVYWDKSYADAFPDMDFLPAALVISRVVSVLPEGRICVDLGHKSIAAENPIDRRVFFLNCPETKFLGQSEEHLVIEVAEGHTLRVGDVLYGMPFHVCPTVALYDMAVVVENGKATGAWKVAARDRRITI